ncbi:aminotransferase class III-fold pyridoxal phosphate-dependent enzyme [Microbacterium sp. CBA3102]|uniref:aminotransferase class III-fold pyridoxal phosphate-dependent enzyme n=1 Tax=Microbacterium sp. CBA3102 TaxID=2603598 RepID=UPI0011BAFF99|nr:aminotransferase class III-fold pyridoxal phosphate-dependent enzyme [Microbacterium sp. CBA3102]QEA28815.1 aminotransferase class III-fold pyridoxal phosphate-dependent enzyme [Microbacterium sp. CBA3102]
MTTVPHLRTEIPGPRSRELHAQREAAVASGFGITLPVFIERAGTSTLEDVDGNTLIDLASGIAVTSVGAANPVVRAEVAAQLDRFTHTCFMVTEYEGFVRVAEWLNEHTPGDFDKRTALFSTGAEAVENAVKIARAHTGRPAVLVIDEAYHGRSLLTMAMTAKEHPYKTGFGPFPEAVVRAPNANPLRGQGADAALAEIERLIAEHGPEHFAALVVEPIQGEGGFVVPAPGFLPGLRRITDAYGIVLVVDEIQSGLGRTGMLFASAHEGVAGDITLTAKALGGGLPLSAVTGRADIMDAAHPGGLGGTYAGNPLACAAALAVFEVLDDPGLLPGVTGIERSIRRHLEPLVDELAVVAEVRGRGAMMAVEFADPGTLAPRPDLAQRVAAACHAAGVIALTCGTHGNVIRLLPPLVIEEAVLEAGLDILTASIRTVVAEEAAA